MKLHIDIVHLASYNKIV